MEGGEGGGGPLVAEALLRASFERHYEGLAVLDACLAKAGATYTAAEVLEEFAAAAEGGASVDEVIPVLFHDAPVVVGASEARRLFSNLFGAWDASAGLAPDTPAAVVEAGAPLPASHVDASWRATDLLPRRELSAQWDRFAQTQSDVLTFLTRQCAGLPDEAFDTAATAAFEMWRSFIGAWPDRVKASPLDLRALDARAASPSAEEREPSLADFCAEALEIAEGEGLDAAAALRPVLAALRTTMSDAWR